jgi:hypothetical protein
MALTCSVLGHAFGDPTVERDREERGSEVVVTIREYETCNRCGRTRVVSENKEVTAVEAEAEATTESASRDQPAPEATQSSDQPQGEANAGAEAIIEEAPGAASDESTPADPAEEDAEIMDAGGDDRPIDEELASPSVADGESTEADPAQDEDAVVIEDDAGERAAGEWPDSGQDSTEPEWTPPEDADDEPEITRSPGQTITVPEGEFHCEECGYTTSVESSSLREGDFCPECHRGSLQHVVDE